MSFNDKMLVSMVVGAAVLVAVMFVGALADYDYNGALNRARFEKPDVYNSVVADE